MMKGTAMKGSGHSETVPRNGGQRLGVPRAHTCALMRPLRCQSHAHAPRANHTPHSRHVLECSVV